MLLGDDGRIKLGDFEPTQATTPRLGSGLYQAPELVTRGEADLRSDVYAMGIMLYEMLTGIEPTQIASQTGTSTVPLPSATVRGASPELDKLVAWMTARDPGQRPRDAREILDRLSDRREEATGHYRTAVLRPEAMLALDEVEAVGAEYRDTLDFSAVDALLGPFFDADQLATWRRTDEADIHIAALARDVLGMQMADKMVFPAFQFDRSGQGIPRLSEVLNLIDPSNIDPWGSAIWLNTPDPQFGDRTAAEALRAEDYEPVFEAAQAAFLAWKI